MNAAAVLERLSAQGVQVTPRPNGNLWLEPASKIPPDLLEAVRENKPAILALLQAPRQPHHRRQKYPGEVPTDAELGEIQALVQEKGVCLLYSHVLKDYVAFYKTEEDRKKIPPGFVPYSDQELWELFGEGKTALSPGTLKLIHEAKKLGGRVRGGEQ